MKKARALRRSGQTGPAPLQFEVEYLDFGQVSDHDLMRACANGNVACVNLAEHPASRKSLERGLGELGYVHILNDKNSGEFRVMKP